MVPCEMRSRPVYGNRSEQASATSTRPGAYDTPRGGDRLPTTWLVTSARSPVWVIGIEGRTDNGSAARVAGVAVGLAPPRSWAQRSIS